MHREKKKGREKSVYPGPRIKTFAQKKKKKRDVIYEIGTAL